MSNDNLQTVLAKNLNNVKNTLSESSDEFKSRAAGLASDFLEHLKFGNANYQDAIENYAIVKPFKALGIALLAGFIVGKVIL
jgi:ElaB/YqjD/DUF883 family membrane-anchored ribosome-binding protein